MRIASIFFAAVLALASAVLSMGSARAESVAQIFAMDNCLGELSSVQLSWSGIDPAASEVSLDLSYQDNGFRAGSFRNSGAMSATSTAVTWDNLPGGRTYYVRLNQSIGGQSLTSPTYFFETCAAKNASTPSAPVANPVRTETTPLVNCGYQTCLVDSTYAGTIVTVPSLEFCVSHPVECQPRYYYEPANGQIMVYPNITPSIYSNVTFRDGNFVPVPQTVCNDGLFVRVTATGKCTTGAATTR